jgi:hypothetical protein
MTFEKKCLIEPSDFISVQYECGKCHAAIVVPIHKIDVDLASTYAVRDCHYCHTPTGYKSGTAEMAAFLEFNMALKRFVDLSNGRDLRMRFNIKCAD